MSSNLPLTWNNKKNSPLLADFIAKYGAEYCMTAEEINQLRDAVNAMLVIQQSTFMGIAEPLQTPSGTGNRYWVAILQGKYTNFGSKEVLANSLAIISVTASGVFSISQTALVIPDSKINVWTAKPYISGEQVNLLGKDWAANADTDAGDVPGTSSKWVERLFGYLGAYNKDLTGATTDARYYQSNGTIATNYPGSKITGKIPLAVVSDLYVKTIWDSNLTPVRNVFFDSEGLYLSNFTHTNDVLTKIPIPENAAFVGITGMLSTNIEVVFKATTQKIVNEISISSLAIKEITDPSGIDITGTILDDKYYGITGKIEVFGETKSTVKIPLISGYELFVKTLWRSGLSPAVNNGFFDIKGNLISIFGHTNGLLTKISIPKNAYSVGVSGQDINEIKVILKLKTSGLRDAIETITPIKLGVYYDLGSDFEKRKAKLLNNNYGIYLAGQSNITSLINYSELAVNSMPATSIRTNDWNGSTFVPLSIVNQAKWGVWWSILLKLDGYLTKPIYSYRLAQGGTSLNVSWNINNASPTSLSNTSAVQIGKIKRFDSEINFKCIIWIQGESDNLYPARDLYGENITKFIEYNRGVVGDSSLPFIVVGMHRSQNMYEQKVRDGQVAVCNADPNAIFINPDSLTFTSIGDNLHYNGVYAQSLASLIFEQIKNF
jgi:hypothetical protein